MPTPTRTLNPLPFQDLDAHRFEDLVRQLAYDFRRWKSLEATGKGGSDDGVDIRAVELVEPEQEDREEDTDEPPPPDEERLWVFQCKREKAFSRKDVQAAIAEGLASLKTPPHGFILAVACDVSKKTRDAFREEMVARKVSEFWLWAKGELEDMLMQAKNDRLLFAFFGLSLHTQRRSEATKTRSRLVRKKQLTALFEDKDRYSKVVLLRDPSDERYPHPPKKSEPRKRWLVCELVSVKNPDVLVVVAEERLAAITADQEHWDAIGEYDSAKERFVNELRSKHSWVVPDSLVERSAAPAFWEEYIPEHQRAHLKIFEFVPFDWIIALDTLGDGYYPVPHVLVEFHRGSPFAGTPSRNLVRVRGGRVEFAPTAATRAKIFPDPLPTDINACPPEFDQSLPNSTSSAPCEAKINDLLGKFGNRMAPATARREVEADGPMETALQSFREWRDATALPVLSGVAASLRKQRHGARVLVHSSPADSSPHGGYEDIELRVRIAAPSDLNPQFAMSGHVTIGCARGGKWQVEIEPQRYDNQRGGMSGRYTIVAAGMSREQVETHVLELLHRLCIGTI